MLIRTTAPVAAASGKQGQDIVFFSWRGAQCARDYARPTNPNTAAQQGWRNTLSTLTKRWKTLTANQRADWASYAAANKVTNRLGVEVTPTALGAYLGIASIPFATVGTYADTPPTAAAAAPPTAFVSVKVNGTDLQFNVTHPSAVAGSSLFFYAYKPASVAVRLSQSVMHVLTFPATEALCGMTAASTTTSVEIPSNTIAGTIDEGELWHFGARIIAADWSQSSMTINAVTVGSV